VYVIHCSTFLGQQEYKDRAAAEQATIIQNGLTMHRRGVWKLLGAIGIIQERERDRRFMLDKIAASYSCEATYWAKGRAGEDAFAAALRPLDERYCLFRNFTPPAPYNVGGDIDAILVGPHGLMVFEVKSWAGTYRVLGERWEHWSVPAHSWISTDKNPTLQVKANVQRLEAFLASAKLAGVPVKRVVALADPNMRLADIRPTGVYIFAPHLRGSTLDRLLDPRGARRLTHDEWNRLFAVLEAGARVPVGDSRP